MLGFVSAHIPWNAISNLEQQWAYKALPDDLALPSATTLSNICLRDYVLTAHAIEKQLPSQNQVCWAVDGWTSTNEPAIMSVIAYHMDRNRAFHVVQLAFDRVDRLLFPRFEIESRMIGQGATYWSNAGHTFEGRSWLFWSYRRPFAWNYIW